MAHPNFHKPRPIESRRPSELAAEMFEKRYGVTYERVRGLHNSEAWKVFEDILFHRVEEAKHRLAVEENTTAIFRCQGHAAEDTVLLDMLDEVERISELRKNEMTTKQENA